MCIRDSDNIMYAELNTKSDYCQECGYSGEIKIVNDKDGKLVASEIKTINGKKYAFDSYGVMKSGLKAIKFAGNSTTEIDEIKGDDGIACLLYTSLHQFILIQ